MKTRSKKNKDPLPETFDSFEALAEFWETHDLTDYEEYLVPVEMELEENLSHEYVITLTDSLNNLLRRVQQREGVPINTLVNLWVQEKLLQYQTAES